MRTATLALEGATPGARHELTVHAFGAAGGRPKIYVQAGLHANEVPGMLVVHHLLALLRAHETAGRITGEIVVTPLANPIGLGQRVLGTAVGRFHLTDGVNFNRDYPLLTPDLEWSDDPDANRTAFRAALLGANAAIVATTPVQHLKRTLLGLALDADLVLDLHCDSQAPMHLYTLTPAADAVAPLAALLGARAVLLATESGGNPFDEACSRPWLLARERNPGRPIPLACTSVTVELRGRADVSHAFAEADAAALADYMIVAGAIDAPMPAIPAPSCAPTLLSASESLVAPAAGIIVFMVAAGDRVAAGQIVADIIDPVAGTCVQVRAQSEGVVFSLTNDRFAAAGHRLGEVAGTTLQRTGLLLTP